VDAPPAQLDGLAVGYLLGLLAGEGHFGGDGRQPQITLRMHVRHEKLFRWLTATFPGGRLYGPYHHGGRNYYQWMARGDYLRQVLVPLIAAHRGLLDDHVAGRFDAMCERYAISEADPEARSAPCGEPAPERTEARGRHATAAGEDGANSRWTSGEGSGARGRPFDPHP